VHQLRVFIISDETLAVVYSIHGVLIKHGVACGIDQ